LGCCPRNGERAGTGAPSDRAQRLWGGRALPPSAYGLHPPGYLRHKDEGAAPSDHHLFGRRQRTSGWSRVRGRCPIAGASDRPDRRHGRWRYGRGWPQPPPRPSALSPASHRAEVNCDPSNRTGRPYSSSIRLARTSNCNAPTTPTMNPDPKAGFEHLGRPFFGELHQGLFQMLGLHRIARADGLQQVRAQRTGCR
jgi:hypothetical protein